MTDLVERPVDTEHSPATSPDDSAQTPDTTGAERGGKAGAWWRAHRHTLAWLSPVLAISGLVQGINMAGSPQRIDDEGTYVAQAYAVDKLGELAHYTFWYDHPPLGWLQIAAWTRLTDAFDRVDVAVLAGREFTLVATLVSVVLLWSIVRRLDFGRPTAAVASLLFAVSPLAVQFHRTVYLDNIATPWLLAAVLLALARKHQLAAFAGAAATFAIAVLTKETYLLALPFLIWIVVRNADRATRRYTLSVASSILVLVGGSYIVLAAVKNEVFPGPDRVSLVEGIMFQLGSRESSGSVFDPDSLINRTFAIWTQLDPVIVVAGLLAAVVGLFLRTTRPFAAMLLFLVLFMFRPGGYLPVPYVIMLLPFAALLIATVSTSLLRSWGPREGVGRVPVLIWSGAMVAAVAVAVPVWGGQLRGLLLADLDKPTRQAEEWVRDNVPRDERLIVDDAMWVDLVTSGFARDNVIWYYKINTDPEVQALSPNGWRDSDYIVTTDSMRTFPDTFPDVKSAIDNSIVVASFGENSQQVDVRRIVPEGIEQATAERELAAEARVQAGSQLTANPSLNESDTARATLVDGVVDSRILLALGQRLAFTDVAVGEFPAMPGEEGLLRRQVLITGIDGQSTVADADAAESARAWLEGLTGQVEASDVRSTDEGVLATFTAQAPQGLLPTPTG